MSIERLPDLVINQIAAGEVVERPVSVVRELVDNAVDARATDIAIYLQQGGHLSIRVVDNGSGIPHSEVPLAFERHATSKLRSTSDLDSIATLGFRGEALPSIASVARVTLSTRTHDAPIGTSLSIEAGVILSQSSVALPHGTDIEVRNLFFNTPARRKFLRTAQTELARVRQWLTPYALANPTVRFRLYSESKEVMNFAPRSSADERAREIFRGPFVSVSRNEGPLQVRGRLAHPSVAEGESRSLVVVVNRRVISDRMILRAVREGFDSTLKSQEYPVGWLELTLDPSRVDVNVHPQKSEVRFRDSGEIFRVVRLAVLEAISELRTPLSTPAPVMRTGSAARPFSVVSRTVPSSQGPQHSPQLEISPHQSFSLAGAFQGGAALDQSSFVWGAASSDSPEEERVRFSELRFIGQIFECYILTEWNGRMYVVDMHAAHERVTYNKVRDGVRAAGLTGQEFLIAPVVRLEPTAVENCIEHSEALLKFGIQLERFGEDAVIVRAAPSCLWDRNLDDLIRELGQSDLSGIAEGIVEERIDHISARIACHASVRSGRVLHREEVYQLFADLDATRLGAACPHGRPVVVSFAKSEVEEWFGRDR